MCSIRLRLLAMSQSQTPKWPVGHILLRKMLLETRCLLARSARRLVRMVKTCGRSSAAGVDIASKWADKPMLRQSSSMKANG
jgi:hypothetical protein